MPSYPLLLHPEDEPASDVVLTVCQVPCRTCLDIFCRLRRRENLLVVVLDAEVTVTGGLGPPLHPLVGRSSILVNHSQLRLPEFSYMKHQRYVTSPTTSSLYLRLSVKMHDIVS